MGLINITDIQTNDDATAELWNSRFATIVNAINGNIDSANLADSAVTSAKLASLAVTSGKIADNAVTTGKIPDAAVTASKLLHGIIRNRQGGTSDDNTWQTGGTNNTDTSAKDVFLQAGSVVCSAATDVTVTFPTAFSQPPIVLGTTQSTTTYSTAFMVMNVTTTGFKCRAVSVSSSSVGSRTAETAAWVAIGQ